MNLNRYMTKNYENKSPLRTMQKQTQTKPIRSELVEPISNVPLQNGYAMPEAMGHHEPAKIISDDMLSGQKPCRGTVRNRKKFLFDDCRGRGEHICRIVFWEGNRAVARKPFALCASASPFGKSVKAYWPKFKGKLKSIPIIFSRNL